MHRPALPGKRRFTSRFPRRKHGYLRTTKVEEAEFLMLLLILLAILTIIAFGVGFTVHWLFIVAIVLAVVWLISLLAGGTGGRTRGAWW
jgi:1,4-dihydroxy-2-naphthoate octaprenyltransferase